MSGQEIDYKPHYLKEDPAWHKTQPPPNAKSEPYTRRFTKVESIIEEFKFAIQN